MILVITFSQCGFLTFDRWPIVRPNLSKRFNGNKGCEGEKKLRSTRHKPGC
ncbi:Uncharacterised protein [Vibrio cholerae]|uniref:Uncharacterized protein n=1 Tax=Vibrio cholerae TaxID=666 RepID=A0A655RRM6_VIBCL|nr:Uncharacterised protein [Vibrio cholerae]CSA98668.1 Uncharacterised protein [Vibrio cholerae]CSB09236.1 Uncharacterised protein [Vibrio cholerae]